MARHTPVMVTEVLQALAPRDGGVYVDSTFGDGGHSQAILKSASCTLYAIDRDPEAISEGQRLTEQPSKEHLSKEQPNKPQSHKAQGGLRLICGRFSELGKMLKAQGVNRADGILFDLGTSARQLENAERGFSFKQDGPLDMRMSQNDNFTAAQFINSASLKELKQVLKVYGEERRAGAIARLIIKHRPFDSSLALAKTIASATLSRQRIHPATRSFQAFRIHINDELAELQQGLAQAFELLSENGVLAVISFHSLEDRIVKNFMKHCSSPPPMPPRHLPPLTGKHRVAASLLYKKPLRATKAEISANPRARSAKLRALMKLAQSCQSAQTTHSTQGAKPTSVEPNRLSQRAKSKNRLSQRAKTQNRLSQRAKTQIRGKE